MGMDVHGLNPKQNKDVSVFPIMAKFDSMGFEKWGILDKDDELREEYWKEKGKWEESNPGVYFRNNVWWWRPLWNYCYEVADDILNSSLRMKKFETSEDGDTDFENYTWIKATYEDGHSNSGAGLSDRGAKLLGNRLMECIASGHTIKYQAEYQQYLDDLPDDDCMRCNNNNHGHNKKKECVSCDKTGKRPSFNKSYPFDVDNIEGFAKFCLECGGFEIC